MSLGKAEDVGGKAGVPDEAERRTWGVCPPPSADTKPPLWHPKEAVGCTRPTRPESTPPFGFFKSGRGGQLGATEASSMAGDPGRHQPLGGPGCPQRFVKGIERGGKPQIGARPPPQDRQPPPAQEDALLKHFLDLESKGLLKPLGPEVVNRTKCWTPSFLVPKKNGGERLISDLRGLNDALPRPRHRPDNWGNVVSLLQNGPELLWGVTLDLKDFFHHVPLHPRARRWMRVRSGVQAWEFQALPFGWAWSPYWAHRLAQPILGWMRSMGWQVVWYVDDLLLLSRTQNDLFSKLTTLIRKMTTLGLQINFGKSQIEPSHVVVYLGQVIDLRNRVIRPVKEKVVTVKHLLRRAIPGGTTRPALLAKLAGILLDLKKGLPGLHCLPARLMRMAGQLRARAPVGWTLTQQWQSPQPKPPDFLKVISEILRVLGEGVPFPLAHAQSGQVHFWSDASSIGWAARVFSPQGHLIQQTASRWTARQRMLHITQQEALAAMLGVQILEKFFPPFSVVHLNVDASAVFWGLLRGSANPRMGPPIQSVVLSLARRGHVMVPHLVKSEGNRADKMSRRPDPQDYSLDQEVFRRACTLMDWWPNLDLFANRINRKCRRFFSWRPEPGALATNALAQPWRGKGIRPLFNPPWALIPQALQKLKQEGVLVLGVLPVWTTRFWWPWVRTMIRGTPLFIRGKALFQGNLGEDLPPPRWATMIALLQG